MKILSYFNFYKKYGKQLTLFTIIFLLSTLYNPQSVAVWTNISNNNSENNDAHDCYIIKFDGEPLSIFENRIKNEMRNLFLHITEKAFNYLLSKRVLEHKNKILSVQGDAKENILKLVNKNREEIFFKEFSVLFNGMVVKNIPEIILEKIEDLPTVESVVPDYRIKISLNDSIPQINADSVWNLHDRFGKSITGRDVTVAIIDTGIDYNHPDLKDNFIDGYDFVNNDDDPMDDNGHGTHCAGIIAGTGDEMVS